MRHPRPLALAAVLFCSLAAALPPSLLPAAETAAVAPELRQAIDALVAALATGDADAYERLARERFAPPMLARRTAADRRQFLSRFYGDFGACRVAAVHPVEAWAADVELRPAAGTLHGTLHVELEPAPPHRIRELGVRVEAGEDPHESTLPPLPALSGVDAPSRLAALLDPYLERLLADDQLSGVVLVAKEGNALYQRAFGLADRERHLPNTLATRFNLASIGKQLTHVAVAQLLAAGKLRLDGTLGTYLPDYPNAAAASKITIEQLLDFKAGVPDIFDVVKPEDPAPRNNHEWFARVAPQPLLFEPGTETRYCNGCYVVLGEVVARLAGTTYEDYLALRVFAPAAMTGAAFLAGGDPGPDQAVGYTRTPAGLRPASLGPGGRGSGAGGVFATAGDLLAFDNALREGRLLDAERTAWSLGGGGAVAAGGRAGGALAVAGGTPGANTGLVSDGTWTVIVLSNRDPRLAEDLAMALSRALRG